MWFLDAVVRSLGGVGNIVVLLWLFWISIEDCKHKAVWFSHIWPMIFVVWFLLFWGMEDKSDWLLHIMGCGLGGVFLVISRGTKEALGYGDSVVFCVLGSYVGVWEMLTICGVAFGLCFLRACIGILWQRESLECGIALLPYVFLGYLWRCML